MRVHLNFNGRWGEYDSFPVRRTYDSRVSFDLAQVAQSPKKIYPPSGQFVDPAHSYTGCQPIDGPAHL